MDANVVEVKYTFEDHPVAVVVLVVLEEGLKTEEIVSGEELFRSGDRCISGKVILAMMTPLVHQPLMIFRILLGWPNKT